jgi:hypothetical protein
LIGLFVLNRLGFVYIASSFAVVLTGVGSYFLIDENLRATFVTMPILIASSLLVPWAEFVVVLIDGLGGDTVNDTTVRLIVNFAYMLGLKVTAEGVENER